MAIDLIAGGLRIPPGDREENLSLSAVARR
jgi:hypothetical protein